MCMRLLMGGGFKLSRLLPLAVMSILRRYAFLENCVFVIGICTVGELDVLV